MCIDQKKKKKTLLSSAPVLDRVYFKQFERPLAATSMSFENDNNEYFIVATGKDTDEFENNSIGRILVLHVTSQRTLRLVCQIKTNGMVDYIRPFNGKLLASVRGMVMLMTYR